MGTRVALLVRPAANRVYRRQLAAMAHAELVATHHLLTGRAPEHVAPRTVGRAEFLEVDVDDDALAGAFGAAMHNLSFVHAAFDVVPGPDDEHVYRPVDVPPLDQFPSDLITIQRYSGKTNEMWTHLGMALAVSASSCDHHGVWSGAVKPFLLDPMSGRGTTLNRALTFGWDSAGIEVDKAAFHDHASFLKNYLRDHRVKHAYDRHRLKPSGERLDVRVTSGPDTAELRDTVSMSVVRGEVGDARTWFAADTFDAVFTDLPYNVQHAGRGGGRGKKARPLEEVVGEALRSIASVARPGAGVALSWNTRSIPRGDLEAWMRDAGIPPVAPAEIGEVSFAHHVDRTIHRDLAIGRVG